MSKEEIEAHIEALKISIGSKKNKSIGEKCRELVLSANLNKKYNGYGAVEFFDKCYGIRSKFVHTGGYELEVVEAFGHHLHEFVVDILAEYEKGFI